MQKHHLLSEGSQIISTYNVKSVDYRFLLHHMQKISGAKYAALNIFDENGKDFTTVCLTGINHHIEKSVKYLCGH